MKVHALLVTYGNSSGYLTEVINELINQKIDNIMIINNNSTSDSRTTIGELQKQNRKKIKIIDLETNTGSAFAFKKGLSLLREEKKCSFIWTLDDDNKPDKNALKVLKDFWEKLEQEDKDSMIALASFRNKKLYRRAVKENKPHLITGRKNKFRSFHIFDIFDTIRDKCVKRKYKKNTKSYGEINATQYGGMFFHKDLLNTIGLPDENFYLYVDDHEFSHRIIKNSGKIFLLLNSSITDVETSWYLKGYAITKIAKEKNYTQSYYALRNRVYFEKKELVTNRFVYFFNMAIYSCIVVLISVVNLKFKNIKVYFEAVYNGYREKLGRNERYKLADHIKTGKKLFFIYSNMSDGGTQRQRSILSKQLQNSFDLYMGIFENIQLHKFYGKIIDFKAPTTTNLIILLKNIIKRIFMIDNLVNKHNFDLIFSSSVIANFAALISKKIFKIKKPLVITFNNSLTLKSEDMGFTGWFSVYLNKKLSRQADKIIAVSKDLEKELGSMGFPHDRLMTIYNGIDFHEMDLKSNEKIGKDHSSIFKKRTLKIITMGRLTTQKDYTTLIEAFSIVLDNMECELIILGDGEKKDELKELSKKLHVESHVHLLGWVDNPYMYLKRSDLFVLSSLWEGFPNVLIEAMGCNVPVISTDCPTGPCEIITSGENGILVPVQNRNKLAGSIIEILSNKKMYNKIKMNGHKRSLDFNIENISKQFERLLNDMIENYKN